MRHILVFAAALVLVPAAVLLIQLHNAHDGIGDPADYLEIERPPELDAHDPVLARTGIPVLCYHYLSPPPGPLHVLRVIGAVVLNLPTLDERDFWSSPTSVFESHLRWLRDHGYHSLTAEELVAIMDGRMEKPEKAVCITFDDGERSLLDLGLPLLEKYDMKATLFVVTGRVGEKWRGLDMMNWAELRQLQDSGRVTIESHTHDMHYKVKTEGGGMEPVHRFWAPEDGGPDLSQRVRDDLAASREAIARHLGRPSQLLAWPYGFGNRRLDAIAREVGFVATFSLLAGAVQTDVESPWHIRRFTVTARTTVSLLEEMVGSDPSTTNPYGDDEVRASAY